MRHTMLAIQRERDFQNTKRTTFGSMSVKAKLSAGFGLLSIAVLIVSGLGLKSLSDANDRFSNYVSGLNARAVAAEYVRTAVDRRAIAARNMALVVRPDDLEKETAAEAQAQQDVQANLRKLDELSADDTDTIGEGRRLVAEIDRIEASYSPVAKNIVALALANKRDEAVARINDDCRPLLAALVKATEDYAEYTRSREAQMVSKTATDYAAQRNLLLAICVAAMCAAIGAGMLITRGLTQSLGAEPGALREITQRIAMAI
jgi:CHASE3 domain sensor protein